ncbi:unnamed protein product [Clonostachys byssicola]|uniref:Ankyrin n=1 Tax=Clonostachys byssicola TaxID=160290 RepID=A0A9N9U2V5_9HYPO|nr:unnamed protein product [Clonostachys byssicola]
MSSPEASLLSAAAFLGHAGVVKRLLENGNDPTHNDTIFPSAIEAAALSGKIEILQLLQMSLPDNVEPTYNDTGSRTRPFLCHYSLGEIYQKGKADIQGVFGAAMNGDTGILEMAIYPPSRADQGAAYFDYMPNGDDSLPKQWRPKVLLGKVAGFAKNWAVYTRLVSLIPELSDHVRAMHLRRFAEYGNFDVVKNLLDAGYYVDGDVKVTEGSVGNSNVATPLYLAARFGNENVVNLLLEYGADVHKARLQIHRPIEGAVKSGSIAIVRKLLSYGAVCDFTIVVQALLSEYTAMVELLLDQFTEECLHAAFGADLAEEMSERGLSSMLDLLYNRECFRYSDGTIVPYSPIMEDGPECPKCGELHK